MTTDRESPSTGSAGASPQSKIRRLGRMGVAALLLLGPLVALEVWARNGIETLYPYMRRSEALADTKRLLLERGGCPDAVMLGSSMTRTSFLDETLISADLDPPIERSFNLALTGNKMGVMYAAWRHVRKLGCSPDWVFIEVSPPVVSRDPQRLTRFLPSYFDFEFWANSPPRYLRRAGFTVEELLEMQTWDALLTSRRRKELTEAARIVLGISELHEVDTGLTLPEDGVVHPPGKRDLRWRRFEAERARREDQIASAKYSFLWDNVDLLAHLVEDAKSTGARVILHTPPTTTLYREALQKDALRWCRFGELVWERVGLSRRLDEGPVWWNNLASPSYKRVHFGDWDHLNQRGAVRYVNLMTRGLAAGRLPRDRFCEAYYARRDAGL